MSVTLSHTFVHILKYWNLPVKNKAFSDRNETRSKTTQYSPKESVSIVCMYANNVKGK